MSSRQSRILTKRLTGALHVAILALATCPSTVWGQGSMAEDLFNRVETLTLSNGTPAVGSVSVAGDTAVVAGGGAVHVFERESDGDHWLHGATLVASDDAPGFGKAVATDGNTTVVGADGAAYIFQQSPGNEAWEQTAKLTGDQNPIAFGTSVAVSGTTVVVGAQINI
jgi:hypothetical protein